MEIFLGSVENIQTSYKIIKITYLLLPDLGCQIKLDNEPIRGHNIFANHLTLALKVESVIHWMCAPSPPQSNQQVKKTQNTEVAISRGQPVADGVADH